MSRPLVVNSGSPRSDRALQEAEAPRLDYVEIAARLGAELCYAPPSPGLVERLERHTVKVNLSQAWRARRHRPSLFLSLSEQTGIPLAWLQGGIPHVLIAHNLTSRRRRAFQRWTRFLARTDRVVVLSRAQERHLIEEAGVPAEKVRFVYDKVDHRFFRPRTPRDDGFILSVGWEGRDYCTLIEAVRPLEVPVVLVPSSAWVSSEGFTADLPPHVEVQGDLSYVALRALYDRASMVVVPIRSGVGYAAGVNALLEAMAMAKPLIVSRTPGLESYVDDGVTARWVPPGDARALRELVVTVLSDQDESARMATRARRLIDEGRNLDTYVEEVASVCLELLDGPPAARKGARADRGL